MLNAEVKRAGKWNCFLKNMKRLIGVVHLGDCDASFTENELNYKRSELEKGK